jgi:hypothetical protein
VLYQGKKCWHQVRAHSYRSDLGSPARDTKQPGRFDLRHAPRTAFTALRRKSSWAAGGNERASVPFMPALYYMRTIYCTD